MSVAWTDQDNAVITRGLSAGDVVNVTPLAVASNGTLVAATIDGVRPEAGRPGQAERQAAAGRPEGESGRP